MRNQTVLKLLLGSIAFMVMLSSVTAAPTRPSMEPSAARVATSEDTHTIEISGGRLTLAVTGAPLAQVLRTIGRKSGVRIVFSGLSDEMVNDTFYDLPLDKGLQRILQSRSSAFVYSMARLERVYVLMSGNKVGQQRQLTMRDARGVVTPGVKGQTMPRALQAKRETAAVHATPIEVNTLAEMAQSLVEESRDTKLRKQAAQMLGRSGNIDTVEPLSQAVLSDIEPSVRETAAKALGNTWDASAVGALGRALREDDDVLVRGAAAQALGETWSDTAVAPLAHALLQDHSRHVRANAALALHRIGSVDAIEPLIRALDDSDLSVRENAALALRAIGGHRAEVALVRTSAP